MTRPNYSLWTKLVLAGLAITSAALWASADGTYFVKSITESHNIVLVATNVRGWLTFLVQDVAASPDASAHPYWYIHHPNLFAKILSLGLGGLGLGLSGQVAVVLGLNFGALLIVVAAFRKFSAAAALASIAIAATSYGSFHFNAGDLCRGPLYLLLWPALYALVANPTLTNSRLNLIVSVVSAMAMLSDWGFGLFVVAFAFCVATLGRGCVPWRWFITTVFLPAAIALIAYELAVIVAVGFDFFLIDAKVTYLGRLGVGDFVDYQSLISLFHAHNVVIWPAQGHGSDNILQLIAAIAIMPFLNTGPAWTLLLPVVICATAWTLIRLRLSARMWLAIAGVLILNIVGLVPLPLLSIVVFLFALRLARVPTTTPARQLTGLVTCVVLGLIVPGLIFPSFTTNFMIGGGRPPLPLLEMSAAALVTQLVASGLSARAFTRLTTGGPHAEARELGWIVAGTLLASILLVATSKNPVFGMPSDIVVGAALLVAGVPLAAAIWFRAYLVDTSAQPLWLTFAARWQMSALLSCTAIALAMHKSANPVIFGRYSAAYAVVLSVVAAAAVVASLLAFVPNLRSLARDAANRISHVASVAALRGYGAGDRQGVCVLALLASVQIGWLVISVAAQPPKPIPYAHVLERPEFQGKSFLTTTYEGTVWYSTRGWAYMTPSNPPPQGHISKRFRHFADWQDEAKYGRPDYYLCDNTRFAYVPAGTAMESEPLATMPCRQCTCRDVSAELARRGHEIVVDRDDYSIVRFRWPALSHAPTP